MDSTATSCNYRGPNEYADVVGIMTGRGMPAMASSAELAKWRSAQTVPGSDIRPVITALDGFNAPAIRNQFEGLSLATIEVVKNGYLLSVTANEFETARKLVPSVLARAP
jgi:hypothetical protein